MSLDPSKPKNPPSTPSDNSNDPFAFVILPHPSNSKDAVFQRQVRRHVAYRWHEDARRKSNKEKPPHRRLRKLAQKNGESSMHRELEAERSLVTYEETETTTFTSSSANCFALTSPTPGPSPLNYLGNGRVDPFNACAVRCNTMESFLLDHYFQTFAAKVSAIYTPAESSNLRLQGMPKEWVSFLITDAGILSGVFLRACRTLSVVTSKAYLDRLALKYRARCIEALSSKIANMNTALSIESIAMMLMLTTDEFYMGSAQTMRYHVDAMQRVVKLKGGLQDTALESLILKLIEWNDLQCTLLAQNEGLPRQYPAADLLYTGFPTFS